MIFQKELLQDIFQRCIDKNLTIITMESCTGGLISSTITDTPGSSKVFDRGLITYSNESKIELLGVSKVNIDTHGAVSREVVGEMATNMIKSVKSLKKISIATTGVAGPGKSEHKPVELIIKKLNFGNLSRHEIRQKTVFESLKLLQENLAR
jgi:nicotinamide-nucleotide amidase